MDRLHYMIDIDTNISLAALPLASLSLSSSFLSFTFSSSLSFFAIFAYHYAAFHFHLWRARMFARFMRAMRYMFIFRARCARVDAWCHMRDVCPARRALSAARYARAFTLRDAAAFCARFRLPRHVVAFLSFFHFRYCRFSLLFSLFSSFRYYYAFHAFRFSLFITLRFSFLSLFAIFITTILHWYWYAFWYLLLYFLRHYFDTSFHFLSFSSLILLIFVIFLRHRYFIEISLIFIYYIFFLVDFHWYDNISIVIWAIVIMATITPLHTITF